MIKVFIALLVLIVFSFGFIYYQNFKAPSLGALDGALVPLANKPNGVSTQAQSELKRVEPLAYKGSSNETMQAIEKVIAEYGGAKIVKKTDDYLYVVFTTPVMKFNDDAEFLLDDENQQVHFRSQSRAGYSDMGLNRKRFNKLSDIYANF